MPTALRAERQRLEHVGAAADAAVDEHRNAVADLGHDFGQRLDRRAPGFRGASAVVRHQDAVEAVLDGRAARPRACRFP